ncbi:MAG: hypothetical protein B7Z10_03415 [Rhodobacterales bacterium 32-66-7]|nr:MAG: hypothetical protein B7Z31_00340 [Rhodobacterales bacterium 12-65-15]OYX26402.1 MAG: hypothetical protein B7Z10_03415 [Rhodobacterales bacterium 32-66-7]
MDRLRLAFIGTGNVAESYATELRHLARSGLPVDLSAVCARTATTAQAFAARHQAGRVETDPDRVFQATDIDAVVILTPMQTHADLALAALVAGKHVFVEKALAPSARVADALVAAAATRGRVLVAAPATPLSPVFAEVQGRIVRGEIGAVVAARAIYGWAGPDWDGWFYRPDAGPLRDLGIYALTTLTGLLGPVSTVACHGRLAEPVRMIAGQPCAFDEPDTMALTLGFQSGAIGTLLTSFSLQKQRGAGIEIYGTRGSLQLTGQDWDPGGYDLWTNEAACWRQFEAPGAWRWTAGLADFCTAVLTNRPPRLALEHTLHVLEIVDAALAAQANGDIRTTMRDFAPPSPDATPVQTAPHRKHK